ncbi:MAG: hypothetical protein HY698_13860 [Deltaproteobacteria bacterium]|nr:hypothetical protein [Deltaproteobacteria bacterium]
MRALARYFMVGLATAASIASSPRATPQRGRPEGSTWGRPEGSTWATGNASWCHLERSSMSSATMCRPTYEACESERQAAVSAGLATTYCTRTAQVACFQIGGDPSPSAEWCSATLEDCERWRVLEEKKNGSGSPPCAVRQ